MEDRLKLSEFAHADAERLNASMNVGLSNDKGILRESEFNEALNEYNIYLDEREACHKIRLTSQVNVVASNVLFNQITEVVKAEDSISATCLNQSSMAVPTTYGKPSNYQWGSMPVELTRDTQLSSEFGPEKDFTYHCGLDIFNNHVLRSRTMTPNVLPFDATNNKGRMIDATFNTISDYLRDTYGRKEMDAADNTSSGATFLHLYNRDNIMSFEEAISERLQDRDGWLGFFNRGKMASYDEDGNDLGINRVVNNVTANAFIEMYPGRSYYTMAPYYNKERGREEKNWDYCITYPFSATTEGIPCINGVLDSLRISHIDESTEDYDGIRKTTVYSSCKHGLQAGDTIRIYRSSEVNDIYHEVAVDSAVVDSIVDEYTFDVYLDDGLCRKWVSVYDNVGIQSRETFIAHEPGTNRYVYQYSYGSSMTYSGVTYSFNGFVNADFDEHIEDGTDKIGSQNLSFARLVDGEPCKYYVRLFARLPNFDFYNGELTTDAIYSQQAPDWQRPVDKYSDIQYEKQSSLSRLAFSKSIYGDDVAQITFTDDIDISAIRDNLGRPLTSLYLSFFKASRGREEWYNRINSPYTPEYPMSDKVEHSHCFGKLTCGLQLSPHIVSAKFMDGNINFMHNIGDGCPGLSQVGIRGFISGIDDDEVAYDYQKYFHGDLCEYSAINAMERSLQPVMGRFNTQQRELSGVDYGGKFFYEQFLYDVLERDDYEEYDGGKFKFKVTTQSYDNTPTSKKEGYYYPISHEIQIRTLSALREFIPSSYQIERIRRAGGATAYTIKTVQANYFNLDSDVYIYNTSGGTSYDCRIQNVLTPNEFNAMVYDSDGSVAVLPGGVDVDNYLVYTRPSSVPSYATVASDGSGRFKWRDVVQNGFEETEGMVEEYPFTNGCLYVNKHIDLFVRRQDPFGQFGLADMTGIPVLDGKVSGVEHTDFEDIEGYSPNGSDYAIDEKDSRC